MIFGRRLRRACRRAVLDLADLHLDHVAGVEHVGRLLAALVRELGVRDQPLDAAEIDERAELAHRGHACRAPWRPATSRARVCAAACLASCSSTARRETTTRLPPSRSSVTRKSELRPISAGRVGDEAAVGLRDRAERAQAADLDLEAALVDAGDLALDRHAGGVRASRSRRGLPAGPCRGRAASRPRAVELDDHGLDHVARLAWRAAPSGRAQIERCDVRLRPLAVAAAVRAARRTRRPCRPGSPRRGSGRRARAWLRAPRAVVRGLFGFEQGGKAVLFLVAIAHDSAREGRDMYASPGHGGKAPRARSVRVARDVELDRVEPSAGGDVERAPVGAAEGGVGGSLGHGDRPDGRRLPCRTRCTPPAVTYRLPAQSTASPSEPARRANTLRAPTVEPSAATVYAMTDRRRTSPRTACCSSGESAMPLGLSSVPSTSSGFTVRATGGRRRSCRSPCRARRAASRDR